ncbi:MAG: flagellar protein FlaG [Thermodesulfobacteriota bacterium]|nr:flagellar protein FlaG [Thermodesulfobacteriota bacterium]
MLIETIAIQGKGPGTPDQVMLSSEKKPIKAGADQDQDKGLDSSDFAELSADIQKNLNMIHNVDLQFSVHESTGQVMVTIRDESTGDVIREIPPREMLNLAAKLESMVGLIFDRKG